MLQDFGSTLALHNASSSMKTAACFTRLALLVGLTAAGTSSAAEAKPASDRVSVIFSHPEKYTDIRDTQSDFENERGRERYLPFIQEYLEKEAERKLPAGQKLTVTFTDIDLAGDFEPWHGVQYNDVRIIKDLYVPRLTFTFKITDANGTVLKEGERKLVELAFQMRISAGFRDDPLRYEKGMLSDWLRDEFKPAKKG